MYVCVAVCGCVKQRRDWIRETLVAWSAKQKKFSAQPFFVESICTDDAIIRSNVRETKLKSPDYRYASSMCACTCVAMCKCGATAEVCQRRKPFKIS